MNYSVIEHCDLSYNNQSFKIVNYERIKREKMMIYRLVLKNNQDVKNLVEAKTKKAAIYYFAAVLHLSPKDLLRIFSIQ